MQGSSPPNNGMSLALLRATPDPGAVGRRKERGVVNETGPDLVTSGFDAVYRGLPKSPSLRRIWRQSVLGLEYPEGFEHLSFLTLRELARMAAELNLRPGA